MKAARRTGPQAKLMEQAHRLAFAAMEERGLSRKKLARQMRLTYPQVSRYMQGEIRTLRTLATLFGAMGMEVVLSVRPIRKQRAKLLKKMARKGKPR